MASQFKDLPVTSGGGGGAVNSVNGQTGTVLLGAVDVPYAPMGSIAATDVQSAINELDTEKLAANIGQNLKVLTTNATGDVVYGPNWSIDPDSGGLSENYTEVPDNDGGHTVHYRNVNFEPSINSPTDNWNIFYQGVNFDTASSGFTQGTNGQAVTLIANNVQHQGTGDIGGVNMLSNYLNLGNGTDPINVKGFGYGFGFANVNANTTISGPLQGWGFQPNVNAAATMTSGAYIQAFYDTATISTPMSNYNSYNASPALAEVLNNANYVGMNINPTISLFSGNAGFIGIGISSNLGDFGTGGFQGYTCNPNIGTMDSGGFFGLGITPNIASTKNANGVYVDMSNVTPYPGVQASQVIQDITYTAVQPDSGLNAYTVEYVDDVLAGSETAVLAGNAITVHIESGVSTATQVKAAWDSNFTLLSNVTAAITGTASNAQTTHAPSNFANGENIGTVLAASFNGDVSINGSLQFSGALSIGKLSAYASQAAIDGGGSPQSIHSLVSNITVAASATVANADTIGTNTAALIDIGAGATVTTSFLGIAALALPAVLTMGAGSTVDLIEGAVFALSLSGGAGGTVDTVALCRSIAIPDGGTTVNKLHGYDFTLPFGPVGTEIWGFYTEVDCNNWFKGSLKLGGTAGSTDKVTNSSVALEVESTTAAIRFPNMTTTQKNALTALAGMQVFDTTLSQMSYYDGAVWVNF